MSTDQSVDVRRVTPEFVMFSLQNSGPVTMTELYKILRSDYPSLTKTQLASVVRDLARDGNLVLEDIRRSWPLGEYLRAWDKSLWFFLTLVISFATLLLIYISSTESSLLAVRWILGVLFVMFVPGYAAVQALFIRPINVVEKFTISLGMSLAIVSLVGLGLDFSQFGINLDSMMMSLTVLIVGLDFAALLRRLRQ